MGRDLSILISELSSLEASVRIGAAEELSRLGDEARAAAVPLALAAGDEEEEVREWVTAALEELGPPSASDAAALAEIVAGQDADAAYWAATLLGRLKEQAVDAAPALCAATGEDRPLNVRERAVWALGKVGPNAGKAAAQALTRAAADSHPRLARLAQKALVQFSG